MSNLLFVILLFLCYSCVYYSNLDYYLCLQLPQLIGYAVGEVPKPVGMKDESEEEEQRGVAARWQSLDQGCYEIITAWVHPRSVSH